MYRKVNRQVKLSQQVADQIEQLYREGKIAAGKRLPAERDLCDDFGVSRTVIREAINILEAKGLLSSLSGSGTYVQEIGPKNVQDMLDLFFSTQTDEAIVRHAFEFRVTLEVQIARIAAQKRTDANLVALRRCLEEMEQTLDDVGRFSRIDLNFHLVMARSTQNPFFEIFLDPYFRTIHRLVERSNAIPDRTVGTLESHRTIVDAVEAGDGDRAAQCMRAHVVSFRDVMLGNPTT